MSLVLEKSAVARFDPGNVDSPARHEPSCCAYFVAILKFNFKHFSPIATLSETAHIFKETMTSAYALTLK